MQPSHIEALRERHMTELRQRLRDMGDYVLEALDRALRALATRDRRLAYEVILGDNRIDAMESSIDRMCQEFLVRHMPVGADLRFVVAAIKVNGEIERIGDYADAIAHRVVQLVHLPRLPEVGSMLEMGQIARAATAKALEAFLTGDVAAAQAAWDEEARTDEMNGRIYDALSHVEREELDLVSRFALVGILNRIERVADRASNIAEDAIFASKGEVHDHRPRHVRRVLLLSPYDATLGPMAEAIALARAPLRVSFASCGLEPRPLDARMVAFMEQRGHVINRPRPRGLADAGPLEDYYVVVTLSREVEESCPPLPYRTIGLAWDIADPSKVDGSPEQIEAAYAAAYDDICAKLADLVAALGADHDWEAP